MHARSESKKGRRYVMAMVLGTALTAMSAGRAESGEIAPAAINDISRYCTTCWRNARLPADRWNDCTQEVFQRLLGTVPGEAWDRVLAAEGDERREFLRAIDAVKKRVQREVRRHTNLAGVVTDNRACADNRRADERAAVTQAADNLLSERQKRILQLSFDGWSVHDLASDLNVLPERVSDEKYKAIRKLRDHFQVR